MREDRIYLEHILEAVMRNFEIIGEATKRLNDTTKARCPDIPWRDIAGFRDVLIHDYMGVNLRRVWNVINQNLADLRRAVEDLLKGV